MKQFFITFKFPLQPGPGFHKLQDEQRDCVNDLAHKGIVLSYTVSADYRKSWMVIQAESEINVHEIIGNFPLIRFMRPEIHEILFHQQSAHAMLQPSLN